MKTIYKYKLAIEAEQTLHIPGGRNNCLLVAAQDGALTIWFEVDTTQPEQPHTIHVVGTGRPVENMELKTHLGSAIEGPFVWHVYSSKP
jgi:hypothetical protein